MRFNSHVERLVDVTVALVNALTPGRAGGRPVVVPEGDALVAAVAHVVRDEGYEPRPSMEDAVGLRDAALRAREVFDALAAADEDRAAAVVNDMLQVTDTRPRLDPQPGGGYSVHFHGPADSFARAWGAGVAIGLAMAIGGDLVSRLGVCAAPQCDRVYVDLSKNSHRRFCSVRCQNRVKTAEYRRRGRR
jgi:predicted RNA-binding Zn ribbon-like protein